MRLARVDDVNTYHGQNWTTPFDCECELHASGVEKS